MRKENAVNGCCLKAAIRTKIMINEKLVLYLVILLVLIILMILILFWIFRRARRKKAAGGTPAQTRPAARSEPENLMDSRAAELQPMSVLDDLKKSEGIGPKIEQTLQEAGITTYAALAAADPAWLREVLLAAHLRLADPTTWPKQAGLAAQGCWAELEALQGQLRGGRSS